MPRTFALICFATFAHTALAVDVMLVADSSADRIVALSPVDGSIVNAAFITDPGAPGGVDIFNRPIEVVDSGAGTLLVSDQFADIISEFGFDGAFIRVFSNGGMRDTSLINNVRGLAVLPNGEVLLTNSGSTNAFATSVDNVLRFDAGSGALLDDFAFIRYGGLNGPFDAVVVGDRVLVSNDIRNNIVEYTLDGRFVSVFAQEGIDFPQQIAPTAANTLLLANFSGGNILEFDLSTGALVGIFNPVLGNPLYRGVAELDNGDVLATAGSNVYRFTRGGLATTVLSGGDFRFVSRITLPPGLTLDDIRTAAGAAPTAIAEPAIRSEADERGYDVITPSAVARAVHPGVESTPVAAAVTNSTPGMRAFIIEDSGFFGAPGVTPGRVASFPVSNPADVTLLGVAEGSFQAGWAGLDRRGDDPNALIGFETFTNSIREIDLTGGNSLIDSVGYFTSGSAGFTYSPDGDRLYAAGPSGSVFRIIEADAETAEILNVQRFTNLGVGSLASVPANTALPYPPGQLWGLYWQPVTSTDTQLRLVQFDFASGTVLSDRAVSGVPFEPQFETGLDWAPDGTLYAAVQGFELVSVSPVIIEEVSSHLFRIDPITASATDLGVIQADMTWDASSITILANRPGDMNCDGLVDARDIDGFVLAIVDPQNPTLCDPLRGDVNLDSSVDARDIEPFVAIIVGRR